MSTESPDNSPLHSKRSYCYIGQTGSTNLELVSYITNAGITIAPLNTARAAVNGSDAVADVETQSLTAKVKLDLYLTTSEAKMLLALGSVTATGEQANNNVDFQAAVTDMIAHTSFTNSSRLDIIAVILVEALQKYNTTGTSLPTLDQVRAGEGYIVELSAAAITNLDITAATGQFVTARLEVESGRFIINTTVA